MKKIAIILLSIAVSSFAFSQNSSNETLENLGNKASSLLDSAKKFGKDVSQKYEENGYDEKVEQFTDDASSKFNEIKEDVSDKIDDGSYEKSLKDTFKKVGDFTKDVADTISDGWNDTFPPKSVKLEDILSSEEVEELSRNGSIKRFIYGEKGATLELYPDTPLGNESANYWQRDKEPVFLVESLYLIDKNTKLEWNTVQKISDVITNLSEMEGIQYYSSSQKKMDTLYTDVYTVNNPIDKVEISDPKVEDVDGLINYVYQKDRSLSGTVYKFEYFRNNYEVGFRGINTEDIHYKIMNLKVVNPENLVLTLNATDVGDKVLFYLLVQADVPKIPFVSKKLATSFSNRAEAIFQWCVDMYRKEEE